MYIHTVENSMPLDKPYTVQFIYNGHGYVTECNEGDKVRGSDKITRVKLLGFLINKPYWYLAFISGPFYSLDHNIHHEPNMTLILFTLCVRQGKYWLFANVSVQALKLEVSWLVSR